MVNDPSQYDTTFDAHIKSYLVIARRLSANICDHTIHINCADHEEAFYRAKEQHAATSFCLKGDTEYLIFGMCRDASCDCEGRQARMDWWRDGELQQWHFDPFADRKTYVQ